MNDTIICNYLDYCRTHKRLSPHSIRAYKNDLQQYLDFGNTNISVYTDHLSKNVNKSSTLKRKIASLKAFYTYLEENSLIEYNPFHNMRFKFRTDKILPKVISITDLIKILNYLQINYLSASTPYKKEKSTRNFLLFSLLLSTGLRISELCHIKIKDLNLSNKTLFILGKGKKERYIYIGNEKTMQLLIEYINMSNKSTNSFLFTGKNNTALSDQSIRLILKTISKKLNLTKTISPHMFRHSFATMLLDNNVDIRYIQQILGHSSINITQIYTHVSQHKQQEILSNHNPLSTILNNL